MVCSFAYVGLYNGVECVCELLYPLMCVRVISEVQTVSPGDLSGHDETSQLVG